MATLAADYPVRIGRPALTGRPSRAGAPLAVRARPAPRRVSPAVARRRRLGIATLVAGAALLMMAGSLVLQAVRTGGGPLTTPGAAPGIHLASDQVWVVQPGDTVWSIAQTADPGADVRPLVDRITAELRGQPLYPGERILIPRAA